MSRIPYAMRVLIDAIDKAVPSALMSADEPDGFDVFRSLFIDRQTTEDLGPNVLELIGTDARVEAVEKKPDGRTEVVFVHDRRADLTDPWPIAELLVILAEANTQKVPDREGWTALEPADGAKLIRCVECNEALATDGTYVALRHNEDGTHTAISVDEGKSQDG